MLSFNHYAYGAVIDWVYRHLAGVAPNAAQPGYRHVILAPKPVEGIDWARAAIDTPYGLVASAWRVEDGSGLSVEVELPFGTSGTFVAPMTPASRITLDGAAAGEVVELSPGRHSIVVSQPSVVSFHGEPSGPADDGRCALALPLAGQILAPGWRGPAPRRLRHAQGQRRQTPLRGSEERPLHPPERDALCECQAGAGTFTSTSAIEFSSECRRSRKTLRSIDQPVHDLVKTPAGTS